MSTVLRVIGEQFDVDHYCTTSSLKPCRLYRRGELVYPLSQPDGRRHQWSGLHVVTSNADFNEFSRQVRETIAFLRENVTALTTLCAFPGVETATLDFGVTWLDVAIQTDHFPAELVRLAGTYGLALEVSHYPEAAPEPTAAQTSTGGERA